MLKGLLSEKCKIETSRRLVSYTVESETVNLTFADGSMATADIFVGADGVHSVTRATMYHELAVQHPTEGYEKFIEPIWSGTHAYRCTVDLSKFKELYPDHQAISYPKIVRDLKILHCVLVFIYSLTVVWSKQGASCFGVN